MNPNLHQSHTLASLMLTIISFPVIWCHETQPYYVGNVRRSPPFKDGSDIQLAYQSNATLLGYECEILETDRSIQTITSFLPQSLFNTMLSNGYIDFTMAMGSKYEISYINDTWSVGNWLVNPNELQLLVQTQCSSHIIVSVNQSSATTRKSYYRSRVVKWKVKNYESDQCLWSDGRGDQFNTTSVACSFGGSKDVGQKFKLEWKLVVGFSCGIIGIMLMLFVILICWKKRLFETQNVRNHQIENFINNIGTLAPKRYKYSEIKKMTNSFLEKLGQGGYGSVYKGRLRNGQLVAVKLLNGAMGDGEDFINEVASISKTSHVNIITLLGFCIEGKKRALIYEFMPNRSLDRFLLGDASVLDWDTLFQIAKGIARGIEYLHQGCNTRIVHFDIKPHNILLDEEFVPKISDFGLAKLCKRKESIVSVIGARGTVGYMAPEVFIKSLGGASHKSDVYSYGMLILEMAGARTNNNVIATSSSEAYFPDWIYKKVEARENLWVNGVTSEEEEELARKIVIVGLWCILSNSSDRPSISKVVEMLEKSFESLQVPPRNLWSFPTWYTPPSTMQNSSSEIVLTVDIDEEGFSASPTALLK